jgi:hypothetical protein
MQLAILLTVLCLWGTPAGAEEAATIGAIQADPDPFHMRYVMLQGTVKEVLALEPYYLASGAGCYGAYKLTLEDATGSLPIAVLGLCGVPTIREAPASVGDLVRIRAQVHAPGRLGSFYGIDRRPIPGANPDALHAVAAEIVPLQP